MEEQIQMQQPEEQMKEAEVVKTDTEVETKEVAAVGKVKGMAMKKVELDKVVLHICAGNDEPRLIKSIKLLKAITGKTPAKTLARKRIATWKLRPGLPIGCKVTLRGKEALEILDRMLEGVEHKIPKTNFANHGFSFGVKEYIQVPTIPYQRDIGIIGFEVMVSLKKAGGRVAKRKIKPGRIPTRHRLTTEEVIKYSQENFKITLGKHDSF